MPLVYINKTSILFAREVKDGETRGLGRQAGHKLYPFVPKLTAAVKVCLPCYTLSGQIHYFQGRSVADELNSQVRFLLLTDVEISGATGRCEPAASYIAVNKEQILSLELELAGMPR